MAERRKKRTFEELRKEILKELKKGPKTVNEIATATGIEWRTVDKQLIFLTGLGKTEPVIRTKYVKIYKLAEKKDSITGVTP